VRDIARRAVEPLALIAHLLREQHPPVLPAAEFPGLLQAHREGGKLGSQANPRQRPHHVGRDDDASADLAQIGGLLVDGGIDPGSAQEQRGRQAAQPAPGDGDAQGQEAAS